MNHSDTLVWNATTARTMAIGAGDLSIAVRNEVKSILSKNRNNVRRALVESLSILKERELINEGECPLLEDVLGHLLRSVRGKGDPEEAYFAIQRTYNALLIDQSSSPTALAIASVAKSAFDLEKSNSVSLAPNSTGAGAAVGAAIGAAIGGLAGGWIGAGIGAAIGGAAGAAIGWCNETGNGND